MAPVRRTLTVTIRIDGVWETLRALKALPPEANDQIRDRSWTLAELLAADARSNAEARGGQAAAVARTVKARRDRVPVVVAGGAARVTRNRAHAYDVLFGSEFGQNARTGWYADIRYRESVGGGRQYDPHLGRGSYWFFETIEDNQAAIASQWSKAADEIIDAFGRGS